MNFIVLSFRENDEKYFKETFEIICNPFSNGKYPAVVSVIPVIPSRMKARKVAHVEKIAKEFSLSVCANHCYYVRFSPMFRRFVYEKLY